MRWKAAMLLGAVCSAVGIASTIAATQTSPVAQAERLLAEGQYMRALTLFEQADNATQVDSSNLVIGEGVYPSLLSAVGEDLRAGPVFDRLSQQMRLVGNQKTSATRTPEIAARFGNARALAAVPELERQARGRQIVILNEAHHSSSHRALATELLICLRKQGFKYFAVETLSPSAETIEGTGIVRRQDGTYLYDPVFADMIRQAVRLGYQLVPYEADNLPSQLGAGGADPIAQMNAREEAQAGNIYEKVFSRDPSAKVFVYVGFGHVYEQPTPVGDGREIRMMATRLAALTKIDPLTIDQAAGDSSNNAAVRFFRDRDQLRRPVIYVQPKGRNVNFGLTDIVVFHPDAAAVKRRAGRPEWLAMTGLRCLNIVDLPRDRTQRLLLQAWRTDDPEDGIPVDQILVAPSMQRAALMLPTGSYRFRFQSTVETQAPFASRRVNCL